MVRILSVNGKRDTKAQERWERERGEDNVTSKRHNLIPHSLTIIEGSRRRHSAKSWAFHAFFSSSKEARARSSDVGMVGMAESERGRERERERVKKLGR